MLIKKSIRLMAVVLALLTLSFTGCTDKNNTANVDANKTPWAVTQYDSSEIIDNNGKFIIDKLTNATVAEMKRVGEKDVIYHLGKPYLFHAMHLRIDHLRSAGLSSTNVLRVLDDGMRRIKESGYDTVILYLNWGNLFDGLNYDFNDVKIQYDIAKKYDLKIMWNWFGYDVCGFGGYRDWQLKNLDKYPPLKDENGNIIYATKSAEGRPIPDLSAQSFIDVEVDAIEQFCAWLNVNDTDRRTIGIQLENEINNEEGGHGLWFSQYSSLINLINELGKAVKEGPYSMITYVNLMSSGWNQIVEGRDWNGQIKGMMDLEYLDIVGYDNYTAETNAGALSTSAVEQDGNPRVMVEFGPAAWSVPSQTNQLLSRGYGIGYYQLIMYYNKNDLPGSEGFFEYGGSLDNEFIYRDGTRVLGGGYNGALDVIASEFIIMNNSIKSLSQLIAITHHDNMTFFNQNMQNGFLETKTLLDKEFTFATDCAPEKYGSTALLLKENDTTYYTYASKTATITVEGGIKSASMGVYKDGKWVKHKDVTIVDGTLTYEAGKAYQIIV